MLISLCYIFRCINFPLSLFFQFRLWIWPAVRFWKPLWCSRSVVWRQYHRNLSDDFSGHWEILTPRPFWIDPHRPRPAVFFCNDRFDFSKLFWQGDEILACDVIFACHLYDHAFELFQPHLIICDAVLVSRTIKHSYVKLQVFERSLTSIIIYDFLYRIHYSPLDSGFFKGRWVRTVFLAIFHPADTAPYRFLLTVFTPYGSAVGSVAFPADQQFCKGIIAGVFAELGFYLFLLFSIEACTSRHFLLDAVEYFPRNNRENHHSAELSDRFNSSRTVLSWAAGYWVHLATS